MKKRFGKQFLCYLLSVTLFASVLQVPVGASQVSPQDGTKQSVENKTDSSEITSDTTSVRKEEKTLDFALNGGSFIEGYQSPSSYPADKLPDGSVISKPGYAFAGWYDNKEFSGEAVTKIDTSYTGPLVLYAKWTDPYYYIDIPANVKADGSELKLSGAADGLYEQEVVKVSVNSENNWHLKNHDALLSYQLKEKDTKLIPENGVPVINLTSTKKSDEKVYVCEVTEDPQTAGEYQDTLTFEIGHESPSYTINYEANGGFKDDPKNPGSLISFEEETLAPGTSLGDLPIAIKSGYTFLGWCYDEGCTRYVATTDRLLGDTTLYAAYTEDQAFQSHAIAAFARAIDVDGASLVIQVTDQSGAMSADEILAACTLKNISDFTEEITLHLSAAGNNTYTISKENGWKEGSNYRLLLDSKDLYFTGFDTSIREYEISIHKDEVKNVSLNPNLKYIHVKELSNLTVNGQSAQSVSVATMTLGLDGSVRSEGSTTTGSFTYTDKKLKIGDQIAVYAGDVIPTMDEVASSADGSDISFFEITGVNGNQYTYRGSKTEDVLFMPDVLPLDITKDQDGDPGNNSVTVALSELAFDGSSISQNTMLSADTTVDEGDFLALYTDPNDQSTLSYGKITSVLLSNGQYIIAYQPQAWEDVKAAMDVYTTESVNGKDLLDGTDVQALESNLEAQAVESGFAEDVAQQIGEMTLRTDSFAELEKELGKELKANVEIAGADEIEGLTAPGSAKKRVEVGMPQVKADLDTKLRHFDGNESGVHLGLEIKVPITFHVARYADFTITVTATFEQEVRVAVHVDGEAVWKVWGIFPYIADYRVTASLDLYEYTGIGLDINFKTEQANNYLLYPTGGGNGTSISQYKKKQKLANDVENIISELEDMMENGSEYISDKAPFLADLGGSDDDVEANTGGSDQISVAKSLAERYADLLEDDGEWVEIYTKRITEQHFRVLLVIDIAIELDFVVWTKVNVSIGMSFWYKNAKRYVFCLQVKGRKATSDTINITEEQYEFTAYAMGTIGVKAGVRLTVRVGLLSTELASVGLSAEVGGYVQLWGYLYYILKYTASSGRNTRAIGALYLEIGIYLDIKFRAQALSNAFTYSPTLFEAMWPLYTAGTLENVLDFADTTDMECNLKYEMKKMRIPDDFFTMNYMDMKEGLDDGEYFTKIYEDDSDRYFVITMTNDAFSYNPETNLITVDPGAEKSVDGEMIVTWKDQPGTFNTKPFRKKVKLHWDMLRDGYILAFMSNGGSYVAPLDQKYGTAVKKPADPVKQGYTFAGWYTDEALTKPYTIPATMPDQDALVYAKWTPASVSYTVKTYLQGANGVYEVPEDGVEKKTALTGSTISPQPKVREGYETPVVRSAVVEADGSTLIEYYYPRAKYTATYRSDNEVVSTGSYRYGTMMPVPAVYKPGYELDGWVMEGNTAVEEIPQDVPAKNVTYFAKWSPQSGIGYTVRYYVEEENGDGYVLHEIQYLTGETGQRVTAPAGAYDPAFYHLKNNALPSGEIKADGSLELRVFYDRNVYTVTYDLQASDAVLPAGSELTFTARPDQKLVTETPEREAYRFLGWYLDADYKQKFDNTMPAQDITLYAKWESMQVNYTVRHYQENTEILNEYGFPEGEAPTYTLVEEEVFTALAGTSVSPAVKSYEGFTSPAVRTEEVTADADGVGTLVIEYQYDRNDYTMAWYRSETELIPYTVQYGAAIPAPNEKEMANGKPGYRVEGWYEDQALTRPFTYETMPAQNLTAYPKWVADEISYYVSYIFLDGTTQVNSYTETYTGLADSVVQPPEVKSFEGYTFDESSRLTSFKIEPGNPYIGYYYQINTHTLTYQYETNDTTGTNIITAQKKYGEDITIPDPARDGYAFAGWYTDTGFENRYTGTTMPDQDLVLYGKWIDGKQSYQVLHYLTQLDGSRRLYLAESLYGEPGDVITPETKAPEGYEDVEPITHTLVQGSVENNRIIYVYPRKQYQIRYVLNGGICEQSTEQMITYGTPLKDILDALPVYRNGYSFADWYTDEALQAVYRPDTMPASDLILYAKWDVIKTAYIVEHYKENVETGAYDLAERSYRYADTDTIVEPAVNQYDGYTKPDVQQGTVSGDPDNRLVIKYYYDCSKHMLTMHDIVCADGISVEDVTEEKKCGSKLPAQARKAYLFGGWYEDAAYTQPFSGVMPDRDLTLYAKWIPDMRSYTFIYRIQNLNGRSVNYKIVSGEAQIDTFVTPEGIGEEAVAKGFTAPVLEPVQMQAETYKNTYTFDYARNRYTVKFQLDNGEKDVIQNGYYGSEIRVPVPKKTGYTFTGWGSRVEDTIPDHDVTYTAQWKINSYHIAFMVDNDDKGAAYQYGQTISRPADPKKEYYTFKNWSGEIPQTMPAKDVNLTAVFEPVVYQITYDLDGGKEYYNPTSYTYESNTIVLNRPTKSHYEFLGWSEEGKEGLVKDVTIPKGSYGKRHFKANWKVITYTISFASDKVVLGMDDMQINYFETKKLEACKKAPKGYKFYCWTTSLENPRYDYSNRHKMQRVERNMTLYPVYTPKQYRVYFDYNLDKLYKEYDSHDFESKVDITQISTNDSKRHKWGYVLDGWDKTNDKNENLGYFDVSEKSFILRDTEDITLKANWKPNAKYLYTPSKYTNSYNITDDNNKEISFKFYVDGKQEKEKVTGDYGLGKGAEYVMNMDNMSLDVVSKNFKKVKVEVQYNVHMVKDGYAVMRLRYKPKNGKEVSWKTESSDLLDEKITKYFAYELDRTDVEYFWIEFDANGGGDDEYDLDNILFKVTYLEK